MTYVTASQSKLVTNLKRSTHNTTEKDMSKAQSEPPTFAMLNDAGDAFTEHPPHLDPRLKDDENPSKPWSIASPRNFEDISPDMLRLFEGKETEQNWDKRRKAIIKIARITCGNGPVEYRAQYISFIKSSLDCILKVVDSLRTNVTTAGLNLLQQIAETLGHGVDFMVDFVAETLIARCCNTSKVKRDPAIATFGSIISNATCNKSVLHYVLSASEHKDPNARTAVAGWLIAILTRNGRHCDQAGLLDLIEKCIKNGLNDAKPQVRTPMRETYTMYAKLWPERAERLKGNLDTKTQKMLDSSATYEPAKTSFKRPSIRDIKAARKKELDALQSAHPESAPPKNPSVKDVKASRTKETEAKDIIRPQSAQSHRPSVRDPKTVKKRYQDTEDAPRPPSAHSTHHPIRDVNTARKRGIEVEAVVRPPSSQSSRPLSKDFKSSRRRDAELDGADRPSSAQSNRSNNRKRDVEGEDSGRPISAHLHTSTTERRFHILSSAPMRPQRTHVDLKRTAAKPAPSQPRQGDTELLNPLLPEDHKVAKQTSKKVHASKNEMLPSSNIKISQLESSRTNTSQSDVIESEPQTYTHKSSPSSIVDVDPAKVGASNRTAGSDESADFINEKRRAEKRGDVAKNGQSSLRQDKARMENPIEIHEDEAAAEQNDQARAIRAIKSRSRERIDAFDDNIEISSKQSSYKPPSPPAVLREIDQLNQIVEPVKRQENIRQKYISTETAERNRSVTGHGKNADKARKQLSRAVDNIRTRTMDDYGYRQLQGLIKTHDALFQDEQKFDELLLALLDILETPVTENSRAVGRPFENKFQILVTIRLMLAYNVKYCAVYHPRALSALITARRNFESRSHIVGGLEETAADIVAQCSATDVLNPVLDVLELQEHDEAGFRAISMGLHILSGLMASTRADETFDEIQEQRVTRFALKCLRTENLETRRATTAFCVQLRRLINPEERYFQMVAGNDEALKSLLTYYIATTPQR